MNVVNFPEQTVVIAKDQPQYQALPAYRYQDDGEGRIVCCWSLSWRERFRLLLSGRIWHQVLTFRQPLQPQLLTIEKPEMPQQRGHAVPPGPREPPRPRMHKEVG